MFSKLLFYSVLRNIVKNKIMESIIPAIPVSDLKKELTSERFVRTSNFANNEIYIVNYHNAPNTLLEIGRLRELAFRAAGGGTGLACDLDALDKSETPYEQLIIWNPEEEEIVGGYRFKLGNTMGKSLSSNDIATGKLFHLSETFLNDYLPYTIELGRSFVQPTYQTQEKGRKSLFALDNLWDGLGALTINYPEMKYFFGKVTMYPDFNKEARDTILYFLKHYFGDTDNLVTAKEPLLPVFPDSQIESLFKGKTYEESTKILNKRVKALGEKVPPLVNAYMNLSGTMKTFGTAINKGFGEVEETAILVTISDIYKDKIERHISSYISQ